jgi:hypothetical protein
VNDLIERHGFVVPLLLGVAAAVAGLVMVNVGFLAIGALLVIVGAYGPRIRSAEAGLTRVAFTTWRKVVAKHFVEKIKGRVESTQPAGRVEAHGTVTPSGDRQISASDSGGFSEDARVDVIEAIAGAETAEAFADRLVQVIRAEGIPSREEFGRPTVTRSDPPTRSEPNE